MSAIAGLFSSNAADARRRLERIHRALAHRGAYDGIAAHGPVLLAQRAWVESAPHDPFSWNSLHIAADAALYNGEELRRALGDVPAEASPAELICRAYARWGAACLERIDGDFAFALWDEKKRQLFCARDPFGVRPFFYRWDGSSLAWASEVKALVADPACTAAPDEAMVGEFLLGWSAFPDASMTFYRGIRQLPGGHSLTLAEGRTRVERYWDIEPSREPRPGSLEENTEEFRTLFARAVQKRLQADDRTGILISGGLDSTSIGSWAEHQRTAEADGRLAPLYVSYVVPDARGDERGYLRGFEEKYSRAVHYLEIEKTRVLDGIEAGTDLKENAFLDTSWDITQRVAQHLRGQQCRLALTGLGGDNIFSAPGPAYFVDRGKRAGWWAGWRAYQRTCSYFGVPRRTFFGPTLRLLLPTGVRRQGKRLLGREIPEWVEPEFARRSGLLDRVRQTLPRHGFSSLTQEEDYRELTSGRVALMLGYYNRLGTANGLEFRHPFFDPALARFTVLAPLEHKVRDGETKLLLRQALEGILPEPTRRRRFKGTPGPFLTQWIRKQEAARWRSLADTARGYAGFVRAARVPEWVNRFLEGEDDLLKPVWNLFALELWLRNSFGT